MPILLRPLQQDDEPFLFELYCDTRAEELDAWGWAAPERDAFLRMQFQAQRFHYQMHMAEAEQQLIILDEQPIGWIATVQSDTSLRLADIALIAGQRNQGIGGALIQGLIDTVTTHDLPIELEVLHTNRAIRLYQRLGFQVAADNGLYLSMIRPAGIS